MFQGQYLDPHAVHEMHQHAIPLVNPAFGYHGHDLASQITPGNLPFIIYLQKGPANTQKNISPV
jgi:hypothetical protein